MKLLDKLYIKGMLKARAFAEKVFNDENGDTNFISIIIVLGIVLALVVVFRGYIASILGKISGSVDSFKNDAFSTT